MFGDSQRLPTATTYYFVGHTGSNVMPDETRRRLLRLTGATAAAAFAGCSSGDGNGTPTDAETATSGDTVPEVYRTATSLGGTERSPDGLSSKESVNYQAEPKDGQQCSGCSYYIEDKNDDGTGACAIVEGNVDPEGYCVSYVATEE
jgi:hypothetical protein